jgi:hypothetical protein
MALSDITSVPLANVFLLFSTVSVGFLALLLQSQNFVPPH